jgi:hypothetical protein
LPLFTLNQCSDKCQVTNTYVYYEPVYTTTAAIRNAVKLLPAQEIKSPGKIYFKDGFLFINEPDKGIHIIDNSNPATPVPKSFLNIPGNVDLAIKGNVLYADSYVDLVAFDISNIQDVKEIKRVEGVFSHVLFSGFYYDDSRGVVTDFKEVKTINVVEDACDLVLQPWGGIYYEGGLAMLAFSARADASPQVTAPTSTGMAGSMSRFALTPDYLYALDGSFLNIIEVKNATAPENRNQVSVNWDTETLFHYENTLFVGSQTGMYIMSLQEPEWPSLVKKYEHVRSCDPVVVEGDYAYVTLRDGNTCAGFVNQLEVIDISTLEDPKLLHTYPMTHPFGLGIDNGTLFICDDDDGLKIFDASDVSKISESLLAQYQDINAYDIIPFQNIAMVIGSDGLYQYDYSDLSSIKLISQIPIVSQ